MSRHLLTDRIPALLTGRWAVPLAALAGAALPLAFAPVDWVWLAVLSPALLFAIAAAAPRRVALWSGYAFGLGFYGVGVSWVYVSIGQYGASGPVLSVLFTLLWCGALALFFPLLVYLARRLRPGTGLVALALGFPLLWMLIEWLRTWLLTGFPWLLIGYSQTDTPLAALAPVGGVLAVGLVLTVLAGLVAWLLLAPSWRKAAVTAAVALAVYLAPLTLPRDWTEPVGEPLSVALIQGNIAQDKKWSPEFLQITLDRYRALSEPHFGVDLIVWPEAAVPALLHTVVEDFLQPLREEAFRHGSEFLIGVPVLDGYRIYNSVVSLGEVPDVYHKRHLVPFGEYLPLRDWLGSALDVLGAPMSDFDRGKDASPLNVAGQSIGVTICYEAVFGPEVAASLPEASLLVNVSNDAWFGDSLAPHQHLQMARFRAVETGRTILRATNTGITAVIGPHGEIVARAPQFESTSLTAQVQPRQGATPYVRWLDAPVLVILFGGLAGLLLLRVRDGRARGASYADTRL